MESPSSHINFLSRVFLATIPVLFLLACSPKVGEQIGWQHSPATIDAKPTEYPGLNLYSAETKMTWHLSNDAENLYLCFKVGDETMQQQILIAGMEVWVDTVPKSKEITGIIFPLQPEGGGREQMGEQMRKRREEGSIGGRTGERPDFRKMAKRRLEMQNAVALKGFPEVPDGRHPLENEFGIETKMDFDEKGSLVYEIAIPLEKWNGGLPADPDQSYMLTVNVKAVELPSAGNGSGPGFGGPGGTGGGPPPGGGSATGPMGRPGGAPAGPPGMQNLSQMTQKHTLKYRFTLNHEAK